MYGVYRKLTVLSIWVIKLTMLFILNWKILYNTYSNRKIEKEENGDMVKGILHENLENVSLYAQTQDFLLKYIYYIRYAYVKNYIYFYLKI